MKTTKDDKGAGLPAVSTVPTSCMAHSHGGRADCAYLTKCERHTLSFFNSVLDKGSTSMPKKQELFVQLSKTER